MPARARTWSWPSATAVLILTLVAGCGGGETPHGSQTHATPAPQAAALAPDGLRATSVYFSDRDAQRLVPVTRYVHPESGLARGAVLALLAGPQAGDPAGVNSAIPSGSRLLGIVARDSVVTVDMTREFESGGGSAAVRMRLAQLVYTLARVRGIRRVRLWLEGQPVEAFSGEGLDVSRSLHRADFPDLAPYDDDPPVVLLEPVPGSTVADPVRVRGTANVFEAHVGLRVRDASGRVVIQTWTTASCGTGCRGTFEKALTLPDSVRGDLVVEAYAPSAKDGSDMHRVGNRVRRGPRV